MIKSLDKVFETAGFEKTLNDNYWIKKFVEDGNEHYFEISKKRLQDPLLIQFTIKHIIGEDDWKLEEGYQTLIDHILEYGGKRESAGFE